MFFLSGYIHKWYEERQLAKKAEAREHEIRIIREKQDEWKRAQEKRVQEKRIEEKQVAEKRIQEQRAQRDDQRAQALLLALCELQRPYRRWPPYIRPVKPVCLRVPI